MSLRRRKRFMVGAGTLAAVAFLAIHAPVAAQTSSARGGEAVSANGTGTPTWYADVLPVVQENCVDCHQPQGKNMGGMVAPFAMTSYEEARPWARMMAHMVETGQMPPWDAHPVHKGTFVGELYLTDREKQAIVEWGRGGAPEGDPADASEDLAQRSADESEGAPGEWWIGEPDLVLTFAEPVHVDDDIQDLNMSNTFVVPDEFTEPKWIKASELHGENHVHHICGEPFGCIAPGWDPYQYPDGYAQLLPPVEEIGLSMHYNKKPGPGTGFTDQSEGALIFYEDGDTIQHFVRRSVLQADFPPIPAGNPNFSYTHEFEFEEDSYILSFTPHMHLRGKSAKYELEYPDGHRELLLWVPEYDFEWQRTYVFKDPPVAPAGSKVLWTATWDNSEFNPANPDPTEDVEYGGPTSSEMANGWMDYTSVEPLNHVVGEDPIPQDILEEVTKQLNQRAQWESFEPVRVPIAGEPQQEGQEGSEGISGDTP